MKSTESGGKSKAEIITSSGRKKNQSSKEIIEKYTKSEWKKKRHEKRNQSK